MDRKASYASDQTFTRRPHPTLPPWEVRSVAQVPFMEPGSPPLMQRDDQGFFTSRMALQSHSRPRLATTVSAPPYSSEYSSPISEDSSTNPWRTTAAAQSDARLPPSYETQTYETASYIPPAPKTAPPTSAPIAKAPPTPPESISRSSTKSPSASPPIRQAPKALPGTMSSRGGRDRDATRARTKSASRGHRSHSKDDSKTLGLRFKSAFKDIFRKDPVDESQFERITDKHWTEDY